MGRVSKAKIDEIKRLYQEGYTKKEVAEKVGVSRGTVAKYTPKEGVAPGGVGPSPVLEEVVKAFYDLLVDLNVSAYLEKDAIADLTDDQSLKLTKRIINVDKEFGKRLLNDNPYVKYLMLGDVLKLSVAENQLDKESLELRREWIELFKRHCPEKLAELM